MSDGGWQVERDNVEEEEGWRVYCSRVVSVRTLLCDGHRRSLEAATNSDGRRRSDKVRRRWHCHNHGQKEGGGRGIMTDDLAAR
jgi:hypothetical protein